MQGFLYINSIQLATLSSKKSSNNLIPPARSRLQGQEKSAKILVQVWASSNLSVTTHAQIWLHHGNHRLVTGNPATRSLQSPTPYWVDDHPHIKVEQLQLSMPGSYRKGQPPPSSLDASAASSSSWTSCCSSN